MLDRILLVDDEPSIRFALSDFFAAKGFAIDEAADLGQAQALLHERHYIAVLVDLRLGGPAGTEGLDVVSTARALDGAGQVILMTAFGCEAIAAEALARGADRVLPKPVSLIELADIVTGWPHDREPSHPLAIATLHHSPVQPRKDPA